MDKTKDLSIALENGQTKISFEDDYKQHCSLQKSNAVLENKIWLGVDKDINGKVVNARMHHTQEQVRELLPYLKKFTDSGIFI
jgi:hypothetical protein